MMRKFEFPDVYITTMIIIVVIYIAVMVGCFIHDMKKEEITGISRSDC